MSSNRVPLVVGALVAAFLLVQSLVMTVIGVAAELSTPGLENPGGVWQQLFSARPALLDVCVALAFGIGVWVSLRWISIALVSDSWPKTVLRGVVATAFGAAGCALMNLIFTFVSSSNAGPYPLGYSFRPTLGFGNALEQAPADLFEGIYTFINCVALVVLAVVLLRLWQRARSEKVTAPASLFAKL